jgi:hypothetical protein
MRESSLTPLVTTNLNTAHVKGNDEAKNRTTVR